LKYPRQRHILKIITSASGHPKFAPERLGSFRRRDLLRIELPNLGHIEEKNMPNGKVAAVGYSKAKKTIEVVIPNGTKTTELPAIVSGLIGGGIIGRLPRGCNTCTSGDHWTIREELDEVINVDLSTFAVVK
jgi:hypothetical protein